MNELHDRLHKYLKEHCNDTDYSNWMGYLQIKEINDSFIRFSVPNPVIKDWIEDKLFHELLAGVKHISDKNLQIRIDSEKDRAVVPEGMNIYKNKEDYQIDKLNLVGRYTFDNFIVGNSNQFAHAAAISVAKSPGEQYNPLFVYGASGLGKTHLIQAIGHEIKARMPNKKIAYVSTETFMNEFITAISNRKTIQFKNKYRELDVLLLDDIHFLKDKEKLQEEMFYTFNELYYANKQIVLTADRLPKDIPNLEERLVTRFQWGLVVDIKKPDFETRLAILKKKVQSDNLNIPDEVLNYIANNIKENVRLLEGVLIKLLAAATLYKKEIDIHLAREMILSMDEVNRDYNVSKVNITPDEIIDVVSGYYKVSKQALLGRKRTRSIVIPRQMCIYLIRNYTALSLQEIADKIGRKDHSTIIHAIKRIEELKKANPDIAGDMSRINGLLNVD